ncbi:MAG: Calx-beta domain-containing protein, partial [Actinomycetota bacterium]
DIVGWHPDPAGDDDFLAKHDAQVALAPGQTEFSIGTLVTGDDLPEVAERVMASIHTVEGCAELPAGQVSAAGTILDDDVQLVSIDDVEVVEGDAGTTDLVFTVSLDAPALIDYSVSLGWGPGTAALGVDVVDDLPDALFFLVGQQSHTVTVSVVGDLEVETDETLSVQLHSGSFGLDSVDAVGFGTILDDDEIAMPGPADDGTDDLATPDDGPADPGDEPEADVEVLGTAAARSALPRTGVTVGIVALLGLALVGAGRAIVALTR